MRFQLGPEVIQCLRPRDVDIADAPDVDYNLLQKRAASPPSATADCCCHSLRDAAGSTTARPRLSARQAVVQVAWRF